MYVCGQVVEPGVYELKNTSRLYEAVQAAGGMTETAADTYLNQAESLKAVSYTHLSLPVLHLHILPLSPQKEQSRPLRHLRFFLQDTR